MQHDDGVYLGHMLDCARQASDLLRHVTQADFDAQITLRLAVRHLIQMIGEAASHVSDSMQLAHADIPWREIIGMHHRIVHDYKDVDEEIIWQVGTGNLPKLIEILNSLVPPETTQHSL